MFGSFHPVSMDPELRDFTSWRLPWVYHFCTVSRLSLSYELHAPVRCKQLCPLVAQEIMSQAASNAELIVNSFSGSTTLHTSLPYPRKQATISHALETTHTLLYHPGPLQPDPQASGLVHRRAVERDLLHIAVPAHVDRKLFPVPFYQDLRILAEAAQFCHA